MRRTRGGVGQLTIVHDASGQPAQGATVPPDEVSFEPNALERSLKKHPRYASLSETLLKHIDVWNGAPEEDSSTKVAAAKAAVEANSLALELYKKLRRDFARYPLVPPVVKFTSYY